MDIQDLIGWTSSFILLATLSQQVYKQWQSGNSEGVSIWLFIGQLAASIGFATYSWLLHDKVFVFTNTLGILNGVLGYAIVLRNHRRSHGK